MFGQRPAFGGSSTSFGGFGTTSTPTGFGSSSFGRPAFGSPATTSSASPFGMGSSTGSSLFGQSQPSSGGLFGSSSSGFGSGTSSGFGVSSTSSGGTGLFGSSNTQSGSGMFGSSTGFNANQNQPKPFTFGTSTTSSGMGTSLFGSNSGGTLFSSNINQSPGTTVQFSPTVGTDTMVKAGVTQTVQTKLMVITTMKEYKNRSMEELRVEDYLANRKGPQQQQQQGGFGSFGQMGQNKFGSQPTTSSGWMSGSNATSGGLFGAKPPENKPLFGSTQSSGFGTSTSGGGGFFGSSNPSPFGQTTTAGSGGFSFGAQNQNKSTGFSFGSASSAAPLFGTNTPATQSGSAFGSPGFSFGNQNQQGGLFGAQNKPAFGTSSAASGGLFASKPASSAPSFFGNTSTSGGVFGAAATSKPSFSLGTSNTAFGAGTGFGSGGFGSGGGFFGSTANQAKPGGLSFGTGSGFGSTPQSTGFSFSQPSTGGGLFGGGAGTGTGGGLFGNTGTGFGTGTANFASGSSFGLGQNQPNLLGGAALANNALNAASVVNSGTINNLIKALTHNPFGTSSLLKDVTSPTGRADQLLNSAPSSPSASSSDPSKALTNGAPTYVMPSGSVVASTKVKPVSLARSLAAGGSEETKKKMMFAGLDDKADSPADDPFRLKAFPSVKKLNLKVFKSARHSSSFNASLEQSTASSSIGNGSGSGGETNAHVPIALSETPAHRMSLPGLTEISPTPDIIKGRNNVNLLQVVSKDNLNDTVVDLNLGRGKDKGSLGVARHNASELEGVSFFQDSPSVDENQDAPSPASSGPHPAGIKLQRAGYYTIPSLEDLAEMVDESGACLVENFTVGRYGYGNVCFKGVTNVADIDLDAVVFIVRKEVEVYPEGVTKPPVGEGLNKCAYVTLDCVWPIDKSTHEVIKCQDRLEAMGWPSYLERQCLKMDATFVEYRSETGSWVFKVKHFSKYGLQDEENEPPVAQMPPSDQSLPPARNATDEALASKEQIVPRSMQNYGIFANKPSLPLGPPSLGLQTAPVLRAESNQLIKDLDAVVPRKKMFLDGSEMEEGDREDEAHDFLTDKESADVIPVCPLSPSAERIALSSRAPTAAMQTLKSQLFFDDFEDSPTLEDREMPPFAPHTREKAEKRDFSFHAPVSNDPPASTFSNSFLPTKKFMSEAESWANQTRASAIEPDAGLADNEISIHSILYPSTDAVHQPKASTESFLREAKTEYKLLSSAGDQLQTPEISTSVRMKHLTEHVPLSQSWISMGSKDICDNSMVRARSFRVGWGPRFTLTHLGARLTDPGRSSGQEVAASAADQPHRADYLFKAPSDSSKSAVVMEKSIKTPQYVVTIEKLHVRGEDIALSESSVDTINPLVESCLRDVLACCQMTLTDDQSEKMDEGGASSSKVSGAGGFTYDPAPSSLTPPPHFSPQKGIRLLHCLASTCAEAAESGEGEGCATPMPVIFDLIKALWGRMDFYSVEVDGDSAYTVDQWRKEALSLWLEQVCKNSVKLSADRALLGPGEDDYLDAVFSYLTARKIPEACQVLQERGDHHLALLLSQSCMSDERPRQIMKEQLSNWAWSGIDAHMSAQRMCLFTLLSGTAVHESSKGIINTLIGLDWKRCLALFMWYICPTTSSISEILKEFENAAGIGMDTDEPFCQTPLPPYSYNEAMPDNVKVNHDICFQLLKLFTDRSHSIESLLETSSFSPDPLDVAVSWLVWCVLQTLDHTLLPSAKTDLLNASMASVLESQGAWHWAAFVLMTVAHGAERESKLIELLSRNVLVESESESGSSKEKFLLQELRVPPRIVNAAKAVRAKALNRVDEEAWYLIQSGDVNSAHKLLLDSIAPEAVINEDHDYLQSYLDEFCRDGRQERVVDWQDGGGVYQAYLEVVSQVNEMRDSRHATGAKVEKLRPKLMALCLRLNSLKCPTPTHRLCISEMSRMVVSVLRAILIENPDGVRVLAQQVTSLPLSHECALEELNHITHQYLASLSQTNMDSS